MDLNIGGAWLTVNRWCNFRCLWCYAKETSYKKSSDMPIEMSLKIIDLCHDIGIKNIILIGGEPTFWNHLFRVTEYIDSKGMTSGLVTNGYLFSRNNYLEKIKNSKINYINVSLKAGNRKQQIQLTETDTFEDVKKGIKNLRNADLTFDVSITVNSLVLENIDELIETAYDCGAKKITLQFCSTTFINGEPQKGYMVDPREMANKIAEKYNKLQDIIKKIVQIEQSLPECIWPKEFLAPLHFDGKISNGCHLTRREGLIFNTNGDLIPCNCLCDFPLGRIDKDFHNLETFKKFWERDEVNDFYNKIISYPLLNCKQCNDYDLCGGGCPLQWFIFEPNEIIQPNKARRERNESITAT